VQGFGCSALRSNIRSNVHSDVSARTVAPLSRYGWLGGWRVAAAWVVGMGLDCRYRLWRLFSARVGFWIGLWVDGALGAGFGVVAPMLVELVRQRVEVLF
jgi:hypothetical protein